ncbi:hypothetical protein Hypma_004247 [Hypsizygus marmoreus]|uniref:Uncharacterized protein n=1 Tax=Hypsizygus marmoreus TaxID=39966 RepID=A0A369J0L7_HYPMA|nr:hypothetical protein Hypma_004247 [Hypsizygus marmoreus]
MRVESLYSMPYHRVRIADPPTPPTIIVSIGFIARYRLSLSILHNPALADRVYITLCHLSSIVLMVKSYRAQKYV